MLKQAIRSPITIPLKTCTLNQPGSVKVLKMVTSLIIENIFHSRRILDASHFEDFNFEYFSLPLKQFSRFDNHFFLSGVRQILRKVHDAIEKGYLQELVFEIKNLLDDEVLEKYVVSYQYSKESRMVYEDDIKSNLYDCFQFINEYLNHVFEPLPTVKDLDFNFYLIYNSQTPSDYKAMSPFLVGSDTQNWITNRDHTQMNIGQILTPFGRLRAKVEGFSKAAMEDTQVLSDPQGIFASSGNTDGYEQSTNGDDDMERLCL